jgi:hypothetical protein
LTTDTPKRCCAHSEKGKETTLSLSFSP